MNLSLVWHMLFLYGLGVIIDNETGQGYINGNGDLVYRK
jgi:hypothetical protein